MKRRLGSAVSELAKWSAAPRRTLGGKWLVARGCVVKACCPPCCVSVGLQVGRVVAKYGNEAAAAVFVAYELMRNDRKIAAVSSVGHTLNIDAISDIACTPFLSHK